MNARLDLLRHRARRFPALVAIVGVARILASPLDRGRWLARRRGAHLLQPATVTWMDRHPALFALLREHLAGHAAPRVLSFGCSTGEEAFTLARYLPGAIIHAVDANPACIARARRAARRLGTGRIAFFCADTPDAVAAAGYDAVLCLSVLRHGDLDRERPATCTALMPFARFAETVAALDRRLADGGMLVLWGCHFRFADTVTAGRYGMIPSPAMKSQTGPFYGPDDRLLADNNTEAFAFLKQR